MIVTLTGANSFGLQRELHQLTAAFEAKYGDLGLERLDGQEASSEQITAAFASPPFLAGKKMVVLREPGSNKQFSEQTEHIISNVLETNDVIIIEPKLDKRLTYYKFLKTKTDFRDFPELDQPSLATWLVQAAKGQGGRLGPSDARYLVERVGASQQLLWGELEKLLLYDAAITRQTIDVLTEPTPDSTIFQLLEAAFAGDHKRVLQLYIEQRALKVEPPQIIAMLAWQLHVLVIIKTAGDRSVDDIAQEARLNPFVVRKSQAITRQLSIDELKKLVHKLLNIDLKSKRTNLDPDEALQHYLLQLAG